MTFTERQLIKKVGADSGWSILESEDETCLILGSSFHEEQVRIYCNENEIISEFSSSICPDRLQIESGRIYRVTDRGISSNLGDYETLRQILRNAQIYFVSRPPKPGAAELYNTRLNRLLAGGLESTEVLDLVKQRIGQDIYRQELMNYWQGACAVTGCTVKETLRASHAKPWAECGTVEERLSVYNGLLLTANLDALFDQGLIGFDDEGNIIISPALSAEDRARLGVDEGMKLRRIEDGHRPFLKYQREKVMRR